MEPAFQPLLAAGITSPCLSVLFPPLHFEERDYGIAWLLCETYLSTQAVPASSLNNQVTGDVYLAYLI